MGAIFMPQTRFRKPSKKNVIVNAKQDLIHTIGRTYILAEGHGLSSL